MKKIILDAFCLRQFDKQKNHVYIPYSPQQFQQKINSIYDPKLLKNGYAPFCKHLIVQNFTPALCYHIEINSQNQYLLRTKYQARVEKQLSVLLRYFPKDQIILKKALFLDIILYSKQQIMKQNKAMDNKKLNQDVNFQYGIISIKPQNINEQIPMDPITHMRNALGIQEGGSGVPINHQQYFKSIDYWKNHALAM